jgi:outer membrane receptor protein involved in Fe transport
MNRFAKYLNVLVWACWFVCPHGGMAQTTGKISGRVTDAGTGEPLIGANVIVQGTSMGSVTDASGDFYIISVPPGFYPIEARMMGYKSIQMEMVRVSVNRTVNLAFKMEPSVVKGEAVTVLANRMVLKKDQTNSTRNISSQDIKILPVEDIAAVVATQPGVVGNHFRGGRNNEAVYLIDGVKVTESFRNESRSVEVNPEAVEDVEVITGTFNAEYGDAMSGVVNIVTKEGGKTMAGTVSGSLGNYATSHKDIFIGLSNTEWNRIEDYKFNLSGPVLSDRLTFLLDGRYNHDPGYLDGIHHFNVTDFSDYTPEDRTLWHTENTGDGSPISLNWNKDIFVFGKLTFKPTSSLRMSLSTNLNAGERQTYNHFYKYNPYGLPKNVNDSYMIAYQMNHMMASSAFYEFKLAYSDYRIGSYLYKNPLDSKYVHDEYSRSNGFSTGGQDKNHTQRTESTLNAKFDYTWQLHKNHYLKAGMDFTQIKLSQDYRLIRNKFSGTDKEYESYLDPVTNKITYPNYEPVTYPDSSIYSDRYVHQPVKLSIYLQDKMEFDAMVVNIGARFDYFDPQTRVPSNYRNPANKLHQVEVDRYSQYPDAERQYQISPRLGLSYQLGESALLRFSYGHFLQLPPLDYFYQNNSFLVRSPDFTSRMGNGNLRAQKTIQYEIGLWQQLTDRMNVEVAVYYRDIYDLVTATTFTTYDQIRYGVYSNLEYGNARGLELKYQFKQGDFSAGLNYTLGYTRGVADDPQMSFNRAGRSMDPVNKLIPLSWDQRHVINAYAGYNTRNFGATLMAYYYSGEAYTWSPISYSPLARINLFPNNQHKPPRFNLDVNAFYNLVSIGRVKFSLTLLAYNLLDRLNEESVNPNTGRAYQAVINESDLLGHRSNYHEFIDQVLDPSNFLAPRVVKLGMKMTF